MFLLKKIYCRSFQTVLKIAIPFLPYRNPKTLKSVRDIQDLLERKKCSDILILTDAGIKKLGLTKRLESALKDAASDRDPDDSRNRK